MSNQELGGIDASAGNTVESESRSQVRGSSLLLAGRLLSSGVGYATQILIIRYLSKSDYGAFAYALSVVTVLQAFIQLGLDRGLSRYLPIYDETGDTGSMIGAIRFVGGLTAALGAVIAVGFWAGRSFIEGQLIDDPQTVAVLAVLIILVPTTAFDNLLVTVLATFRKTRAIFLREYVMAPLLKLLAVGLLIRTNSSVQFLAAGYAVAGIVGVAIFVSFIGRYLAGRRAADPTATIHFPIRALATFSLPLLTTDLVFMAINGTDSVLLQFFGSASDVAAIRAVQPTAKFTQLVLQAFGVLYIPYVARLYARGRHQDVSRRYWETANWIMVLTLPVLTLCLLFNQELTTKLLGAEYSDSAVLLGVLAGGYFVNAMFGFNGMTLNVYRKIGFLVSANGFTLVANISLNLLLIPRYGPLGAAMGTAGTFLIHNLAKQYGLIRKTDVSGPPKSSWLIYTIVVLVTACAAFVGYGSDLSLTTRIGIWVVLSLGAVVASRGVLQVEDAFPGLGRIPLIKYLVK